ncbi:CinA family protein [Breznakiella homolactica]|uniref:Nicotinamide-nucleotide amidohydrolase family protein n=1 Tax=Breznakiella homolactica TaxID=2798577 RepID=A0A7T7XL33_9SPIR|nr:nicotinamide-nucleotide amidohydrolase family protein [Breznakiella homolactica]QQO08385.1 nicotinamide-nucleotide amidohydrolase family protein [Breznakiella homolactica]
MADDTVSSIIKKLAEKSWRLAAAESCTAGLVADLMASVPGASKVFWGSYVTYSIESKTSMLGVDPDLISRHGAVSEACARAMSSGACQKSGVQCGVSVTGLAGPDGDGSGLPVGTVWIAVTISGSGTSAREYRYTGSRNTIRRAAAEDALRELYNRIR